MKSRRPQKDWPYCFYALKGLFCDRLFKFFDRGLPYRHHPSLSARVPWRLLWRRYRRPAASRQMWRRHPGHQAAGSFAGGLICPLETSKPLRQNGYRRQPSQRQPPVPFGTGGCLPIIAVGASAGLSLLPARDTLQAYPAELFPAVKGLHHPCNPGSHRLINIRIGGSQLNGPDKAGQLIADPLPLQLIKAPAVFRRILIADLKIVRFPPGSGDINIPLRPGNDQLALRLYALPHLNGGCGVGVQEVNFGINIKPGRLINQAGDHGAVQIIRAQKLKNGQHRQAPKHRCCSTPLREACGPASPSDWCTWHQRRQSPRCSRF